MIGKTLSHYEILGQLGAGGMGEVYRARDTRLSREVAIKVLPAEFARDEARLARFQREATLLASLSHANIATLYGLDEANGLRFLVMELVEGEDLADRLKRGPLPVGETLAIAASIATSLEAAHAKGVVHRDLKPGNIRVTPEGVVKVLDFGLAKATAQDGGTVDMSRSPTVLSTDRTVEGVIMGTAAYMSPEQARGKTLDRRTDIWSFGCVLYECLTGRQAFSGETVTDTLAKILERDPDWDAIPETAPPTVRYVIRRALEKDPNKRWRDMGDVGILLDEASAEMKRGPASPAVTLAGSRKGRWLFASLAVVLTVGAYFLGQMGGRRHAARSSPQAPRLTFSQLTVHSGLESTPSVSSDGSYIIYQCLHQGNWDIFLQRIGGYKPINLTEDSAEDDVTPAYSPDGQFIAFRSSRQGGGIFVMGSTGESVRRVSDVGYAPSWSPDGQKIVFATEGVLSPLARNTVSQLWTLDIRSGEKKKISDGDAVQPRWSPHARRIAYWGLAGGGGARRDIYTIDPGGGNRVAVTTDPAVDWNPVWSPDGTYLYFASDRGGSMNIWRVPIDEESGRTRGQPEALTAPTSQVAEFDVSKDGRSIVYTDVRATSNISRASFDRASGRAGAAASVSRGSVYLMEPDVSPDGQWVVCRAFGREDLYLVRSDGSETRKLTDDPYRDRGPKWSSDGTQIAFYSDRGGRYEIWSIHPDGSGLKPLTQTDQGALWYPVFSPDDSKMLVCNEFGSYVLDLRQIPVKTSSAETLPSLGDAEAFQARAWSRDGRFAAGSAVRTDGSPAPGVFVYSFGTRTYQRFSEDLPLVNKMTWVGDSRHLALPNDGRLYLLDITTAARKVLLDGTSTQESDVTATPDGSEIFFVQGGVEEDLWQAKIEP